VDPAAATTLPGKLRLKTQRDFRGVYGRGGRASSDWVTVVVWPRRAGEVPAPRVGVSVSKEHGGAVRRNKLKRVLREAFRLERARMPQSCDVVLIPRKRPDDLPLAALRAELVRLVEKAYHKPKKGRRGPRRR
jgi:ribonuclease P protein component